MAFSLPPPVFTVYSNHLPIILQVPSLLNIGSSIAYNIVRIFNDTVDKKSRKKRTKDPGWSKVHVIPRQASR